MPSEPAASPEESHPKPRPADEPPQVLKLRELIEGKLAEMVDYYAADADGNYVLGLESARVFVVPDWFEEGNAAVVRMFAITNMDVPVTAELTGFLLAKNLEFVLGAFALDPERGAIWFTHNLLGEHVTPDEFAAVLAAVSETSNRFDDEIKSRFGGRLYVEAPDQATPAPPTAGYL